MSGKNILIKILGFGLSIVIILTVASGVKYFHTLLENHFFETYDFPSETTGPGVGETISLNFLKNKNEMPLSESQNGKIIVLGVVDPDCGACKVAKDQISRVRDEIQSHDVQYIPVSFTSRDSEKFFKLADSFGLSTNAFLWSDFNDLASESLQVMVVPSHLLIDSNGRILKKFEGTNKDRIVRMRMANQIIKEVLQEKEKNKTY